MTLNTMWDLTSEDITKLHEATLDLFETTGIGFLCDEAIEVFKANDFRVEDHTVFFTEAQIAKALESCPSSFTVYARNEKNNVVIGGGEPVFSPIYGPPHVVDFDDNLRRGTLDDYHTLTKLAQSLPNQDMVGYLLCDPSDVESTKAHLHMLYSSMVYSDKPFMGASTQADKGVEDMMQMGEIVFDCDREYLKEHPFSISLINSLTPLRYEEQSIKALMACARNRQPMLIASLVTGGATGPITMGGTAVLQNAEVLAGIVLAQLINPGTPVIYGCASGIMDMRTVVVSLGAPEFQKIQRIGIQLGHHYGLPCRGGGGLTESCDVDAQAGMESMSATLTAMDRGVDFVQHASGCVSSYLAASFNKLVFDDEVCGYGRDMRQKPDLTDEGLALDIIKEVGPGGEYLTNMHTAMHCRDAAWMPELAFRGGLDSYFASGKPQYKDAVRERGMKLVENFKMPAIDEAVKAKLDAFMKENG